MKKKEQEDLLSDYVRRHPVFGAVIFGVVLVMLMLIAIYVLDLA